MALREANAQFHVTDGVNEISITSPQLEAKVRKRGYVSGVAGGSFLDKKSGFRDPGFGLDIVDWLMEPGSDEAYRAQLPGDLPYEFNNLFHGKMPKRSIEGPQICTQAKQLSPSVTQGGDFVAVRMDYKYPLAAPGKNAGSRWEQTLVFPKGKRWFYASDKVTTVNASDALFLRTDLPGHIQHQNGDTFSEVYLSYRGRIPSTEFAKDFAPDEKFLYQRGATNVPTRMIRAYRLRDKATGQSGPWLAGMTLQPEIVSEAWCHQRGYVCFIQEIGGQPIKAGETFSAAYIIGYFDSIAEMERIYDQHKGTTGIELSGGNWRLVNAPKRFYTPAGKRGGE
ncbi:MAG TPA: hypothetical protein VEH27_06240 [Methylomirabilota bacterium]|nr:hypothetical protein [Methylomirabilota bacterium]